MRTIPRSTGALLLALSAPLILSAQPAQPARPEPAGSAEAWRTWGGPRGNFTSPSTGLAGSWPADGPPRLWSRTLGDGYSGIAQEDGVLYTAYRRGANDVVVALKESSGRTRWETAYPAPFGNAGGDEIAPGPYAMPQVVGDRIVMASGTGRILSLDKRTGRIVWQHDLYQEYGGTRLGFGYSCHALPYKDTLIVLVGGRAGLLTRLTGGAGSAVVAFKQSDGAVAWQNLSFENAHSSPLLVTVDGQRQVVALLAQEVIGFSPEDGTELWRHAIARRSSRSNSERRRPARRQAGARADPFHFDQRLAGGSRKATISWPLRTSSVSPARAG